MDVRFGVMQLTMEPLEEMLASARVMDKAGLDTVWLDQVAATMAEEALEALGLEAGAIAAEIDAAYKTRARQNGSLNGSEKLSRARDVLRGGT